MNRYTLLATVVLAFGVCTSESQAQPVNPAPPGNSLNTLNLLRGGNPALNYFGIVRPNNQNQSAWMNAQAQINTLSREEQNNQQEGIRPTGVAATFMNTSHFYPRAGGAGRPGGGASGARR